MTDSCRTLTICATEIDYNTYEHTGYIMFPLDGDKEFCYRSRTSYNAFSSSSRKKRRNRNKDKFIYYCQRFEDRAKHMIITNDSAPIKHVNNIWEFYEFIGYDYKNNKWA